MKWLVALAAMSLSACGETVVRRVYENPSGEVRVVHEHREAGGAAGSVDDYIYLEGAGGEGRLLIAHLPNLPEDLSVFWSGESEVQICTSDQVPRWMDHVLLRTARGDREVRIGAVCPDWGTVSQASVNAR